MKHPIFEAAQDLVSVVFSVRHIWEDINGIVLHVISGVLIYFSFGKKNQKTKERKRNPQTAHLPCIYNVLKSKCRCLEEPQMETTSVCLLSLKTL